MYCNHCGASNPDGAVFCNSCGKPISGTGAVPVEKTPTGGNDRKLQERTRWCDFLGRFREHVLQVAEAYDHIATIYGKTKNLQEEKADAENRLENDKGFRNARILLIAVVILEIGAHRPSDIGTMTDGMKGDICILVLIVLVFLYFLLRRKKWRHSIALCGKNIDLLAKKSHKEVLKLKINFEGFEENRIDEGVYIVGFEYSSPWMLQALEDAIRNGKADTPKEAIACYETEQERRRNQQERLRSAVFQQALLVRMDELNDQMAYLNSIASADFVLNGIRR